MSEQPEKQDRSSASSPTAVKRGSKKSSPGAKKKRAPLRAAKGTLVSHALQILLGLALVGTGSLWMNTENRTVAIAMTVGGIVFIVNAYMKIGSMNEIET